MDAPLDAEEFERWRQQADSAADTAELGEVWPAGFADAAARLARHYIATRYPDAVPSGAPASHYTDADAAQAGEDADALLAAVDEAWRVLVAA